MLSPGPAPIQISQEQGEDSSVGICHRATLEVPHDRTRHQLQAPPSEVEPPLVGKVTLLVLKAALAGQGGGSLQHFRPVMRG